MWFVLRNHFMELFGLNLLVLVFFLPLVTIPAAISGMTKIIMKWLTDDPVFFWHDFFGEFKSFFGKRLIAWLVLVVVPISLALYAVMFGYKNLGLVILALVGLVSVVIQGFFFPILVMVDIPVSNALKDAVILSFSDWKISLRIMMFAGILFALCFIFTLYAIPVIVICLIALYQLIICLWVKEPIFMRLIKK